jgi:uncharacterized protein YbjT (DUF2867 family)
MSDILVAGGTGLVGGHLLDRLSAAPDNRVHALLRRPIPDRPTIVQHVVPTADWPTVLAEIRLAIVISTLGTTLRQAGSRAAFYAIDHDLVLAIATAAKTAGARQCIAVSSVGANPDSGNFYLRTKGKAERALGLLGFDRLDILRPGLLLGQRGGAVRPAERLGMALAPFTNLLTPRGFDRYRAIQADSVAAAIAALVGRPDNGQFVHHNREMLSLAD